MRCFFKSLSGYLKLFYCWCAVLYVYVYGVCAWCVWFGEVACVCVCGMVVCVCMYVCVYVVCVCGVCACVWFGVVVCVCVCDVVVCICVSLCARVYMYTWYVYVCVCICTYHSTCGSQLTLWFSPFTFTSVLRIELSCQACGQCLSVNYLLVCFFI